ncbi:AlpA family phage regulatory protein [Sphingomonadales bacterium 56]|uniref:helix-turn-helix transcriptional regulator n=1 Tax=Sphingobium sp. S6 TaxID=2758386 RepID=UPI00191B0D84|nr:AlpA family phage regulatory protein [Sphingobium sp. S6]MBY2929422.1 AlpA family phage regulatory protein [Sphingomonadales bacterium 56]
MTNARAINTQSSAARAAIRAHRAGSDDVAELVLSLAQALSHLPAKERQCLISAILPICVSYGRSSGPEAPTSRSTSAFLRIPEVMRRTGLKRSTLYNKIAAGTFPAQIHISSNCAGWREEEVSEWCSNPI